MHRHLRVGFAKRETWAFAINSNKVGREDIVSDDARLMVEGEDASEPQGIPSVAWSGAPAQVADEVGESVRRLDYELVHYVPCVGELVVTYSRVQPNRPGCQACQVVGGLTNGG